MVSFFLGVPVCKNTNFLLKGGIHFFFYEGIPGAISF